MTNCFSQVSVITLNYNQSRMTVACIQSILKSKYENFRIFVVDNGSSFDEYKYLKESVPRQVEILRLKRNRGYVGGINYGLNNISKNKPDYFLIMNNDTRIDENAIMELVKTSRKYENKCIVSGKSYHYNDPEYLQYIGQWCRDRSILDFPSFVKNGCEFDKGQYDKEMEMDMLDDMFWLLPYEVYENVGNYSRYFFLYGEQNDYALRAVSKGFKLIYTPYAKIWHKGSVTSAGGEKLSPKITFWKEKSYFILLYFHASKKNLFKYYCKFFFKRLIFRFPVFLYKVMKNDVKGIKNYHALWVVFFYFNNWMLNKRFDNGYNPF